MFSGIRFARQNHAASSWPIICVANSHRVPYDLNISN